MYKTNILVTIVLLLLAYQSNSQSSGADAIIYGQVTCKGCDEQISFATIYFEGTTIGTTTNENGHFRLSNLPEGIFVIKANYMGFKTVEKEVIIRKGSKLELNFQMEEDVLGLEEVIITGDRNKTNRKESSTLVHAIPPQIFTSTQSVTLSEGLNFCPGLRMENNCQNCGFSQVRMNGMEGPYSQILINSRPIFSGLAGVYGLELIPAAMIERVEVIRGGGSALYGSNAIAGTVNLILKDPVNSSFEFGINSGIIGVGLDDAGKPAGDHSLNFNSSLVSADNKTGISLYGFFRDRQAFDANNDGFSEMSSIKNTTIGSRLYHRFGKRSKLSVDFFNINESRRGGNKFDHVLHESDIAEAVDHNIISAAVSYDQFFRKTDLLSAYFSAQAVNRDSYYGAEQSLSDYGKTNDLSISTGVQYNAQFQHSKLTAGIEHNASWLHDQKMGYMDLEQITIGEDSTLQIPHTDNVTIADQSSQTSGLFAQYEFNWNNLKVAAGARFDNYRIKDLTAQTKDKTGQVLSPRLSIKYGIRENLQCRFSYSQGYRAPQIFDEDLHLETSGSRQVVHKNSPDLIQESSRSIMASMDFNQKLGNTYFGVLVEGFYTRLLNPFANEYSQADEKGVVTYTRVNAESGAVVQGVNLEMNLVPSEKLSIQSGFTLQKSRYDEAQEFGEKKFFRTPQDYGYLIIDWDFAKSFCFSINGNYTGKMLIPYFGINIDEPELGELRESKRFMDVGLKLSYEIKINGATLALSGGVKNVLNSYQDDFDRGINRDPGYIYGPMAPRMVYLGIKIGNFLNK